MPTRTALDAVVDRLKHPTDGYNAKLAEVADERDEDHSALVIDFATPGRNFFKAHVAPQAWVSSTEQYYPTMFLFVAAVSDGQRMRGGRFSGRVTMGLDVVLGAWESRPPANFEDAKALVTDAVVRVFSDGDAQLALGVNYVGDISATIPALQFAGPNWASVLSLRANLFVEV